MLFTHTLVRTCTNTTSVKFFYVKFIHSLLQLWLSVFESFASSMTSENVTISALCEEGIKGNVHRTNIKSKPADNPSDKRYVGSRQAQIIQKVAGCQWEKCYTALPLYIITHAQSLSPGFLFPWLPCISSRLIWMLPKSATHKLHMALRMQKFTADLCIMLTNQDPQPTFPPPFLDLGFFWLTSQSLVY